MKQEGEILEKFQSAIGAIQILRDRAWFSACFIEYILLSTSLIDALLRWALFVKGSIDPQGLMKDFREREVIRRAAESGILDKSFCARLNELYDDRNVIVHRFFITDIDYEFSKRIAGSYEPTIKKLRNIIHEIEGEELPAISEDIVPVGKLQKADKKFQLLVQRKIGNDMESINKVRAHKWTDVEDIIEYTRRKGFFVECKNCSHQKISHVHLKHKSKTYTVANCRDEKCKCRKFKV